MTVRRSDIYRIYARWAREAHLSFDGHIPICPADPHFEDIGYWRGSGNQDEIDRANALPVCEECLNWLEAMHGPPEITGKGIEGPSQKQIEPGQSPGP